MNASAIIVTRGDVDLQPVTESLPVDWEVIIWDNGAGVVTLHQVDLGHLPIPPEGETIAVTKMTNPGHLGRFAAVVPLGGQPDLSVYGRYAAIQYASGDLIYVQDDDVIVSDPREIVEWWHRWQRAPEDEKGHPHGTHVVFNMPQEFRPHYTDSCLVGFGACFHRDAPARAFDRFWKRGGTLEEQMAVHMQMPLVGSDLDPAPSSKPMIGPPPVFFQRTCDVVFTCLTPRVLVDVPKVNREFAEDANRMYRQPGHVEERTMMLELARKVRDGR